MEICGGARGERNWGKRAAGEDTVGSVAACSDDSEATGVGRGVGSAHCDVVTARLQSGVQQDLLLIEGCADGAEP